VKPYLFIGKSHRLEHGDLVSLGRHDAAKHDIEQKYGNRKKNRRKKGNLNTDLLDLIDNEPV